MNLIILDRDGVINYDSDEYIKSPDEWIAIPGSLEAIAKLNQAGFTVAVATNQSGIGRKLYSEKTLHLIHEKMQNELKKFGGRIEKIFYCPHIADDHCNCRKPKTGLLEQIATEYKISLQNVPVIGDSLRDLQAAKKMGCKAILVRTGNGEVLLKKKSPLKDVLVFGDLTAAADAIIQQKFKIPSPLEGEGSHRQDEG